MLAIQVSLCYGKYEGVDYIIFIRTGKRYPRIKDSLELETVMKYDELSDNCASLSLL